MGAEQPFAEMANRFWRAARNNTRLHLDPEHVRALMRLGFHVVLAEAEAKEITSLWDNGSDSGPQSPRPANDSNSGGSGSGTGPTGTTGASVGSMAVQLAAEEQVSEAVEAIRLQSRRKRP